MQILINQLIDMTYANIYAILLILLMSLLLFSNALYSKRINTQLLRTMSVKDKSNSNESNHVIQNIYENLKHINNMNEVIKTPLQCTNIKQCLELMNSVTLADLGLHNKNLETIKRSFCMHIVETNNFHVSIFIIPKNSKLPLHDHPNMSVLSKVIKGTLKMKSYNIEKKIEMELGKKIFPAHITHDNVIKTNQDKSWFLTPSINNIHAFEAINETAVVFDVLMPPYDDDERPCNFYEEYSDNENHFLSIAEEPTLPSTVRYEGYRPIL